MPVFRRLLVVALLLAAPRLAAATTWQCATTKHFTLYASEAPDSVAHLARDLERMAELLAGAGMGSQAPVRARVFLIAFPDRKSFEPHQPFQDGKRSQVAGYAESTPYGHWIGYVADDQQGRWTANHEFIHTIADEMFESVPTCLNEGMAEFYSTSYADARAIHYGEAIPWHRETLREGELMPLDDLFGSKARSLAYGGGQTTAMFYSESWILVHDLVSMGGPPKLKRFAELTASGTAPKDALAQVYPGLSWDDLPAQLKAYAAQDDHFEQDFSIPVINVLETIPVAMREADPAEIAVHTGLWRMQPADADQQTTRTLFEEASHDPKTSALATDGFALLALRGAQPRDAEKGFRAAAADPGAEPLALTIAGAGLLQIAAQDTAGRRARVDEALAILERSVNADSLDAHALAWYGEGSVMAGRVTPRVIRALDLASQALPGDPKLAEAAAQAQRAGSLAARGIPTGQAAIDSVNAQLDSQRYDAAIETMKAIEDVETDSVRRALIHDKRVEAESIRDQNRAVEAYNRGVTALRSSDFVNAAREFDAARDGAKDPGLRDQASARLEEIPSYEAFQHGLDSVKKNNYTAALTAFQHARDLAKSDELRKQCDRNIAQLQTILAKKPAH
jgi:hypothetical protein